MGNERNKIFYGAAIQGEKNRGERAHVHRSNIDSIKAQGYTVFSEHTTGKTRAESSRLMEESIGPLPPPGPERIVYVRNKMIEAVEGNITGAVFEVSTPSTGTGIEIAHAYLRPRMGITAIPILLLYQVNYWPNKLSTMVSGITAEEVPNLQLEEYEDLPAAVSHLINFLSKIK